MKRKLYFIICIAFLSQFLSSHFVFADSHGTEIKAELKTIQYNDGEIIESEAELKYEWSLNNDSTIKQLEQKIETEDQFDIKGKYNYQKDETEIKIKTSENEEKQTLSGLVIVKLITKSGVLDFEF